MAIMIPPSNASSTVSSEGICEDPTALDTYSILNLLNNLTSLKRERPPLAVYAIDFGFGETKIGVSATPVKRIQGVCHCSGRKCVDHYISHFMNRKTAQKIELALKKELNAKRISGEFYREDYSTCKGKIEKLIDVLGCNI